MPSQEMFYGSSSPGNQNGYQTYSVLKINKGKWGYFPELSISVLDAILASKKISTIIEGVEKIGKLPQRI